jgi:hypothetical protein
MNVDIKWSATCGVDPDTENRTFALKVNGIRIPAVHASEEVCERASDPKIRRLAEAKIRALGEQVASPETGEIDWGSLGRILVTTQDLR